MLPWHHPPRLAGQTGPDDTQAMFSALDRTGTQFRGLLHSLEFVFSQRSGSGLHGSGSKDIA